MAPTCRYCAKEPSFFFLFHHECEGAIANTWFEMHSARDISFLWRRHGVVPLTSALHSYASTLYASALYASTPRFFHTPHHTTFSSTVLLLFPPSSPFSRRILTHSISHIPAYLSPDRSPCPPSHPSHSPRRWLPSFLRGSPNFSRHRQPPIRAVTFLSSGSTTD